MSSDNASDNILLLLIASVGILCVACASNRDLAPASQSSPNHTGTSENYCRKDKTFRSHSLTTPILFAHRGGVLEVPESTERAFRHALAVAKADVLELDVQLTRDGKIVVWHGPELDNVYLEGQSPDPGKRPRDRRTISQYAWCELEGKAWVADPGSDSLDHVLEDKEGRQLMLLSEFLDRFPESPLNVEIKTSFKSNLGPHDGIHENIEELIRVLDAGRNGRDIVVVSASHAIIKEFRNQCRQTYITNLSWWEQFVLIFTNPDLRNRVLETVYDESASSKRLVERVRRLGGSTYVFLTKFGPYPGIDQRPDEREIRKILDRGVDGIMTDRPTRIRKIVDEWKQQRCAEWFHKAAPNQK